MELALGGSTLATLEARFFSASLLTSVMVIVGSRYIAGSSSSPSLFNCLLELGAVLEFLGVDVLDLAFDFKLPLEFVDLEFDLGVDLLFPEFDLVLDLEVLRDVSGNGGLSSL